MEAEAEEELRRHPVDIRNAASKAIRLSINAYNLHRITLLVKS